LAAGGVVGPVAFVTAWSALGATASGYSLVNDAISRLAASGAPTDAAMSAGFAAFGAGMGLFGVSLRWALPGPSWILAVATGAATVAVAALPVGTAMGDTPHHVAAAVGYATLAALPLAVAAPLAASGRHRWARWSRITGAVSAACLLASTVGPAHGLFQRAGLTVVDAWVVATAVAILRGGAGVRALGVGKDATTSPSNR
jgi:hypothetical protein